MDMDESMQKEMMKAQIAYLMIPLMIVLQNAGWRYRYSSYYDSVGTTALTTNYASMLDMACGYWMMTTHIILFITQLLSMVAGMAELNVMAWMYIGMANMVFMAIMGMAWVYSYNLYWDDYEENSDADAASAMAFMEMRKMTEMAFGSHYMLALYMHHMPWMMAQWMALPEETQMAWKEKHDMDKKDHEMDDDDMYALFGF